jgi:hypothetical protein
MASFQLAPGEEFVQCPYEKAHQVTNFRLATHLSKCRANHKRECERTGKPLEYGICRFNRLHQVHKLELEFHEENCQDQYNLIPHLQYHQSDEFKAKVAAERGTSPKPPNNGVAELGDKLSSLALTPPATPDNDGENWDADARNDYLPGYDPKKKLETGVHLVMPSGLKPAERKAYRRENVRKAREQAEREDLEKYGPRTGSVKQSHSQLPPIACNPYGGPAGSVPINVPIGLTIADVMSAQSGTGNGKNKKKKKKKARTQGGGTDCSNGSESLPPNSAAMLKTEVQVKEEEEACDYDWQD